MKQFLSVLKLVYKQLSTDYHSDEGIEGIFRISSPKFFFWSGSQTSAVTNKEHEMGGQKLWSGEGKAHITGRSTQQSKGFVLSEKTYFRVGSSILRTSFCLKEDRSGVNFTYRWSFEHGFEPDPWYDADCLRTKCSKCSAWKLPVVGWFSKAMSTCVSYLILASAQGNGIQHTWKSGQGNSRVFTNATLPSCNDYMWDVQIHLSMRSGKFSRCIFIRLAQLSGAVSLVTIIWY